MYGPLRGQYDKISTILVSFVPYILIKLFILKTKYTYNMSNITIFCYSYMFLHVILSSTRTPHAKFKNFQNIVNYRSNTDYLPVQVAVRSKA